MTKKQKKTLYRILTGTAFFIAAVLLPISDLGYGTALKLFLFLIPYFIIGGDVLWKAIRNIRNGQIFDENFLMCIATIGAFILKDYSEGVFVMLFYQVGEFFQNYAVNRSRKSISDLMDIRPDYANVEQDGGLQQVDPEDVTVGMEIVVKAGERIPLDGFVKFGESLVDTSALTGESVPREVKEGTEVLSGCINIRGLLRIQVTKEFGESTVSRILDMVENASSKKANAENFITRFARYYTPMVVFAATMLAVIPPLLFGQQFSLWLERALIFLVISCPCALVISVPLSFFGGIGGAGKCGILVKGSNYLEVLSQVDTVVFDKTGTLTKGIFKVTAVHPVNCAEKELLEMAALAENYSDHPISNSIAEAYGETVDAGRIKNTEEISGYGIRAEIDENIILAGNKKLMEKMSISFQECDASGTVVYIGKNGQFAGSIVISDEVKEDAAKAIQDLKKAGIEKTVMLTGDRKLVGEEVAAKLGLDIVYTELLPGDKVDKVEELLAQQGAKKKLAFIGDGINDAPVLSRADIGIAMGGMGSDAAIEAADIVLMDDEPSKIAVAVAIARKTLLIVKQNIIFAFSVKLIVLIMGAFGIANMWEAVFADVGVSVIAILNATRALSAENSNRQKNKAPQIKRYD